MILVNKAHTGLLQTDHLFLLFTPMLKTSIILLLFQAYFITQVGDYPLNQTCM